MPITLQLCQDPLGPWGEKQHELTGKGVVLREMALTDSTEEMHRGNDFANRETRMLSA